MRRAHPPASIRVDGLSKHGPARSIAEGLMVVVARRRTGRLVLFAVVLGLTGKGARRACELKTLNPMYGWFHA